MTDNEASTPFAAGEAAARELFTARYARAPEGVWAAPGRVNLIGEHTDYNGGLALPIALPHRTYVAAARRGDGRVRATTRMGEDEEVTWEGDLGAIAPGAVTGWVAYTLGPLWALRADGADVPGLDLALVSDVPLGAGLSSSAAVECAVTIAADELAGNSLDDARRVRLAELCVRAENEVAGAPTGGMDQAASLRATKGHALLLDCRDGSTEQIPVDLAADGLALLVIDTRAGHALGDGQYGARRAVCEEAAATLGVATLREIDPAYLGEALARLDGEAVPRTRHVVTEIARVRQFAHAARTRDWRGAGALMNASHASLRDDYEVSCVELDTAVEAALAAEALGARMTGGGFGGSAIALVRAEQAKAVGEAVLAAAAARGLVTPQLHTAVPAPPAARLA